MSQPQPIKDSAVPSLSPVPAQTRDQFGSDSVQRPVPLQMNPPQINQHDLVLKRNRKLIKQYWELHRNYLENEITQSRQLALRHIASTVKMNLKPLEALNALTSVANDLMLEELEVALWNVYLKKQEASLEELDPDRCKQVLLFTAYAAKSYFHRDIRVIQAYCTRNFENFKSVYTYWRSQTESLSKIGLAELNQSVKQLSSPCARPLQYRSSNYNVMVDQLMKEQLLDDLCSEDEKEDTVKSPAEEDKPKELLELLVRRKEVDPTQEKLELEVTSKWVMSPFPEFLTSPFFIPHLSPTLLIKEDSPLLELPLPKNLLFPQGFSPLPDSSLNSSSGN